MKKTIRLVMLTGLLVLQGHQTESFGFGGLYGGRGARDMANLAFADRLGAFTPPADPFANKHAMGGSGGAGYPGLGAPAPRMPSQVVAPRVSASQLMNPSVGGLANLGRTMSSSAVAPAAPVRPQSYALPSDMGLHSFSPFSIPQQ